MAQYDKFAREYKESELDSPTKNYVQVPTLLQCIGNIEDKKVLDLACGWGFFTRILAGQNPKKIIGADISREQIKLAKEFENKNPLGITYLVKDVKDLRLNERFDLINSVFLLNYAETKKELEDMCSVIYNHLSINGTYFSINPDPDTEPRYGFKYGVRVFPANKKHCFGDRDPTFVEFLRKGMEKPISVLNYHWSKETYENSLKKAGFKSIKWVKPIISKEGIKRFGEEYWKEFKENPTIIGLICR